MLGLNGEGRLRPVIPHDGGSLFYIHYGRDTMARQQVVYSECDRCHVSEEAPLSAGIKNGKYVLPKGWLHVEGVTNTATVFEVDMCTECKGTVMEAAGHGRRLRAVSNSA